MHRLSIRHRCHSRGFTLVELMVTVVIITIIAAIALPSLRKGIRDRRTRLAAEEVARVYRNARLRAMGRGSAVLVRYNAVEGSFTVREAVAGQLPSAPATCSRLPASSCTLANFAAETNTLRGSQLIESVALDEATEKSGLKVIVQLPTSGATPVGEFSVCFTPLGRSYVSTTWPPTFNTTQVMSQVPIIRIYRTELGETAAVGLERRVVLLPNGQARMQTAAGGPS